MIAWTIYITFAGALGLLFLPQAFARWIALLTAIAGFVISLVSLLESNDPANFSTITRIWATLSCRRSSHGGNSYVNRVSSPACA